MGLNSKRRRRTGVKMRRMNLLVPEEVFEKLEKMAGPLAHNAMVEELTEREWRRRVKRQLNAQVAEKPC